MYGVIFNPQGEYCITDKSRRDMLVNLEMYRAALEKCNGTILEYNKTVPR
jgi:hypothetical protein